MFCGEKKSSVAEEMNDKEKVALLAKNTQGELVTVYGFSTHKWYDCKTQNYNMRKTSPVKGLLYWTPYILIKDTDCTNLR